MKKFLGNIALASVVTLVCLVLAEIGLRAFTPFPIHGRKANKVYDIDAGYRLYSGHPNIDEHGFRNKRVDKPHVMAAIGDSHTFGSNVKPDETWPVQFERKTGVPTYNFGVGSYAVYAHYANANRAIDQGYKYIIIALLIHNDFKVNGNSCDIDYADSEFWQKAKARLDLHLPDCSEANNWRTAHAPGFIRWMRGRVNFAIVSAIDYLVVGPLSDQWHRLTYKPAQAKPAVKLDRKVQERPIVAAQPAQAGSFPRRPASAYFAERSIKNHEVDFAFTDLKRKAVLDGIDDFEKMLADLKRTGDEKGVKIGVMFIPTKVQLFYEHTPDKEIYDRIPLFKEMAQNHVKIEKRLSDYMDRIAMPWITAAPEIMAAVEETERKGQWVYPTVGGHPHARGYIAYTDAAIRLYRKMGGS